jgi:hypothetical protein
VDSTKPASRSTRRCFDTVGCVIRSWRSISPTDCCDETRRLSIARRFGSAMISKDSILLIYPTEHIRVKVYLGRAEATVSVGVAARGGHVWDCGPKLNLRAGLFGNGRQPEKSFHVKQEMAFELRASISNVSNRVNLANPFPCVDCGGGGAIFGRHAPHGLLKIQRRAAAAVSCIDTGPHSGS